MFVQVCASGVPAARPTDCERNAEENQKPGETVTTGASALGSGMDYGILGPNVISISYLDFFWFDFNLVMFWEVNGFKRTSIDGISVV